MLPFVMIGSGTDPDPEGLFPDPEPCCNDDRKPSLSRYRSQLGEDLCMIDSVDFQE